MTPQTDPENPPNTPEGGVRALKKAHLRERISAAASELFERHGHGAVTMEQIAVAAGVSKRTLYKYFPAKEAVLAHMLEAELARDLGKLGFRFDLSAGFRDNVSILLEESAAWCERHPDFLLPYIQYKFTTFELSAKTTGGGDMVPAWKLLIVAGQERGELDATRPPEQLAIYFHYLYLGALMRWITDRELDLKEEFAAVVRLFVEGARP